MYSDGGTDDRDSSHVSSHPWDERARDRRYATGRHHRSSVDLTIFPWRRARLLGHWKITTDGVDARTDLFIRIRDEIFDLLHQRRLDEDQSRLARQSLRRATKLTLGRYAGIGWIFSWTDADQSNRTFHIAIREGDALTRLLDRYQRRLDEPLRKAV